MIGIYLMGLVILVSGVGALGTSIAYAVRPTEQKLVLMRPLSLASIFAAVCSFRRRSLRANEASTRASCA